MVPMAPSSTRIFSRARARSAVSAMVGFTDMMSRGLLRAVGTEAEQVADREHEISTVHRIEVEVLDTGLGELLHLARRHRRRDQLAGLRIVVEPFEFLPKPGWHAGATLRRHVAHLLE